jgi:hypothetical protein
MPVRAPFLRSTYDATGGLKELSGVGRIKALSALRLSPVCGHRHPPGGRRRNSGRGSGGVRHPTGSVVRLSEEAPTPPSATLSVGCLALYRFVIRHIQTEKSSLSSRTFCKNRETPVRGVIILSVLTKRGHCPHRCWADR